MSMRRLLCIPCGHDYAIGREDERDGWRLRKLQGLAHKPPVHNTTTTTIEKGRQTMKVIEELPTLLCDLCGKSLPDGTPAIATTQWRSVEPPDWESEYLDRPFDDSDNARYERTLPRPS